jgi:uncharacterized integral membrane protein
MSERRDARRAPRGDDAGSAWWTSRWVLVLVLVVLALVFVLENRDPVAIRLLVPVVTMPQWAALVTTLVIGVLVGLLVRRR